MLDIVDFPPFGISFPHFAREKKQLPIYLQLEEHGI